jgi:hypothetical protein
VELEVTQEEMAKEVQVVLEEGEVLLTHGQQQHLDIIPILTGIVE